MTNPDNDPAPQNYIPFIGAFVFGVVGAAIFRVAMLGSNGAIPTMVYIVVGLAFVVFLLGALAYTFLGKNVTMQTKMLVNAMVLGYLAHTVVRWIIGLF